MITDVPQILSDHLFIRDIEDKLNGEYLATSNEVAFQIIDSH